MKKTKNEKFPGSDGFTNEFYKAFQTLLVPLLCKTCNWALENRQYADTWNSAVITIIHKEGKEPIDCASYRPISLLNVDHK